MSFIQGVLALIMGCHCPQAHRAPNMDPIWGFNLPTRQPFWFLENVLGCCGEIFTGPFWGIKHRKHISKSYQPNGPGPSRSGNTRGRFTCWSSIVSFHLPKFWPFKNFRPPYRGNSATHCYATFKLSIWWLGPPSCNTFTLNKNTYGCLDNRIHPAYLRRRPLPTLQEWPFCMGYISAKFIFTTKKQKHQRCMTEVLCPQPGCNLRKLQPRNPNPDHSDIGGLQKDCRYHTDDREDLGQVNDVC